ncbi:hypothetical protein DFH27DRAFT_318345 [Peziza echinospora]|nr:hypothetical protein DFH27DRAFT_318345 [Peziza echinospora]
MRVLIGCNHFSSQPTNTLKMCKLLVHMTKKYNWCWGRASWMFVRVLFPGGIGVLLLDIELMNSPIRPRDWKYSKTWLVAHLTWVVLRAMTGTLGMYLNRCIFKWILERC